MVICILVRERSHPEVRSALWCKIISIWEKNLEKNFEKPKKYRKPCSSLCVFFTIGFIVKRPAILSTYYKFKYSRLFRHIISWISDSVVICLHFYFRYYMYSFFIYMNYVLNMLHKLHTLHILHICVQDYGTRWQYRFML